MNTFENVSYTARKEILFEEDNETDQSHHSVVTFFATKLRKSTLKIVWKYISIRVWEYINTSVAKKLLELFDEQIDLENLGQRSRTRNNAHST